MLLLDATFDSQPQEAVEVDWANPLASGLVHATVGNNLTNLAGPPLTPTFGTTELAGWGGPTPGIVFNNSVVEGGISPSFRGVFTTGLCLHTPASLNASGRLLMGAFTNEDSSNCRFEVSATALTAGYRNALNESAFSTGIITPQVGQTYMHGGRWTADAVELWVDGQLIATTTAGGNGQIRNRVSLGGDPTYGGFAYIGTVHLSLWWNRALTDDEIRSVSANPWQLFRAPVEAWVPRVTPTVLTPDATVSNTNWSAVGAASLHAALAAGDSDYITASTSGAVTEIGLSNPAAPLTLTDVSFRIRARLN